MKKTGLSYPIALCAVRTEAKRRFSCVASLQMNIFFCLSAPARRMHMRCEDGRLAVVKFGRSSRCHTAANAIGFYRSYRLEHYLLCELSK